MSEKEPVSENSVPVQEIKSTSTVSVKRFIKSVAVVLLSAGCMLVGVLIYQLHSPLDNFHPVFQSSPRRRITTPLPTTLPTLPTLESAQTAAKSAAEPELQDPVVVRAPTDEPMMDLPPVAIQTPEPEQTSVPIKIAPDSAPTRIDTPVLTLSDLLKLRDKLDDGQPCFDEMKQVIRLLNDEEKSAHLMMICTPDGQSYHNMTTAFRADKRYALMSYYQMKNPRWLAYAKALGSAVVDVRRLHPRKQSPKDIISSAQNALAERHFTTCVAQLEKLPPRLQEDFAPFLTQARAYIQALSDVDELIYTFEKKGK